MPIQPLSECRLYAFVDTTYLRSRSVADVTRQLCDGGSDLIQLRAKSSSALEIQQMAETMAPITEDAGVYLVINNHPEIACALPHPFCHLGQEDFFGRGFTHISQ